jgi:hypothetical protein
MKSTGSNQGAQSSGEQKTHSAWISNRPPDDEERHQEQVPPRGQAKKDPRSRSRSSAKR